jgi:hypothetical protein
MRRKNAHKDKRRFIHGRWPRWRHVMAGVPLGTLQCTVQTTSERACSEEASMRGAIFVVEVKAKSRSHRDHDGILLMGLFSSNNQQLPIFLAFSYPTLN